VNQRLRRLLSCFRRRNGFAVRRRPGVCQLRCDLHAAVAPRWHRTLSVQRMRTVPQNERHEQTACQAGKEIGRLRDREFRYLNIRVEYIKIHS